MENREEKQWSGDALPRRKTPCGSSKRREQVTCARVLTCAHLKLTLHLSLSLSTAVLFLIQMVYLQLRLNGAADLVWGATKKGLHNTARGHIFVFQLPLVLSNSFQQGKEGLRHPPVSCLVKPLKRPPALALALSSDSAPLLAFKGSWNIQAYNLSILL